MEPDEAYVLKSILYGSLNDHEDCFKFTHCASAGRTMRLCIYMTYAIIR